MLRRPISQALAPQCAGNGATVLDRATPERLSAFSDGVFAVLITVLVLELRPPELPTFEALLVLWPTWLSYAVSYLFIAIVAGCLHAAVFFLVNATYICLIREVIDTGDDVSPRVRRIMRVRSIATLCLFGVAAVVALKYPRMGLGICCCCLIVYLKPDPEQIPRPPGRLPV